MKAQRGAVAMPVGPVLNNGFDNGGSRFYPWSTALALQPNAQFSSYVGPASGNPIVPPVAALVGTTGTIGAGISPSDSAAVSSPFGMHSPLIPVLGGLVLVLLVMYHKGYKA